MATIVDILTLISVINKTSEKSKARTSFHFSGDVT